MSGGGESAGLGAARQAYDNIITETRRMTLLMSEQERFQKAHSHVTDALRNKALRPLCGAEALPSAYSCLYALQSSAVWSWLVLLLSYFFMYLVVLDCPQLALKLVLEGICLAVFLFDTFVDFYTSAHHQLPHRRSFPSFLWAKAVLLLLMLGSVAAAGAVGCPGGRPIRPLRLLRAGVPVVFDQQLRKMLLALGSCWREMVVFVVYYSLIIVSVALIGSVFVQYTVDEGFDQYLSNYNSLERMIFQTYVLATYDNYPDNQLAAIRQHESNYPFFIAFVFFNMFLFASIPGSLIYNQFRETRTKHIIMDEIQQQHSLIVAFVTLAQDEYNLAMEVLVRFLFFFYRRKVRFIEYITEICLRLDDNNNFTIVNEFMQLSKIILSNSTMLPPAFDDLQPWLALRTTLNRALRLKHIVNHLAFQVVSALLVLLAATNALVLLYHPSTPGSVLDSIFLWLFVVEIMVRIVGHGPEAYFAESWNRLDCFLVLLSAVFFPISTSTGIRNLLTLNRLWRVGGIIRLLAWSPLIEHSEVLLTLRRMFSTFLEIMPIILRFFCLFACVFFVLGILGMEIFYTLEGEQAGQGPYGQFAQFSNFGSFVGSQLVMMQILTEGSWSVVTIDYVDRSGGEEYWPIVILFTLEHMAIVVVLATFLKGIFWEVYFTVSSMAETNQRSIADAHAQHSAHQRNAQQINHINQQIRQQHELEPHTLIQREIIEKKLDQLIVRRIGHFDISQAHSEPSLRSLNRSKLVYQMMSNRNIPPGEIEAELREVRSGMSRDARSREGEEERGQERERAGARESEEELGFFRRKQSKGSPKWRRRAGELEWVEEEELGEEMEELLGRLIVSPRVKYSEIIAYPRGLMQLLEAKFRQPQEYVSLQGFDLNLNPLHNEESMKLHVYELNAILGSNYSTRQKKEMIVECLAHNRLINPDLHDKITTSQLLVRHFRIDTYGALRKMYLSDTNQDLVRKLEVEYFSDVYGNSFKQINKITLGPLLKVEATLSHSLWNILAYPAINNHDFFQVLTHLEDQISNKLLKLGSLAKFVYKLDHESDIWFSVEQKRNQEMRLRFIKTGLWAYVPGMKADTPYYARDVFSLDPDQEPALDPHLCQQYIKLLFESFETLALSLIDKEPFFSHNAAQHIYDLFTQTHTPRRPSAPSALRLVRLRVSHIMLAILSKQEERIDFGERQLPYALSDIRPPPRRVKKEDFLLDEEDKDTFEKLKNIAALDNQKIIESEGLPFAYILNLMRQISDLMRLYGDNFVQQVETALNRTHLSADLSSQSSSEAPSLENILVNLQQEDQAGQ